MFFGITSSRSLSSSRRRRQRLRSAIATARLASPWPTMKRSSSETISRGEKSVMSRFLFRHSGARAKPANPESIFNAGGYWIPGSRWRAPRNDGSSSLQGLDRHVAVGVDADIGRDRHRLLDDRLGVHVGLDQRAGGRERVV